MSNTQQPVTHTVDLRTAVDPVDSSANTLASDVRALFPDSVTSSNVAVIRRAPIYDQATNTLTQEPELGTAPVEDPRTNQPRIGHLGDQPTADDLDLSDPSDEAELLGETLEPATVVPEELPTDAGFEQFAQQFEKYMGVPLTEAQATVQQLQQFQQQVAYERQMSSLANDWGISTQEADTRLADVRQRFSKLSPVTQETLAKDPVRAAQLIWQKLETEKMQRQTNVPKFDTSGTRRPPTMPRGAISKAEIQQMSNDEYQRRQPEILDAYAKGLVY